MKTLIRKYGYGLLNVFVTSTVFLAVGRTHQALVFVLGFFCFYLTTLIRWRPLRRGCVVVGGFLTFLAVIPTQSFWLSLLVALSLHVAYKTQHGSELVSYGETLIHPFDQNPQASKRAMIDQQSNLAKLRLQTPFYSNLNVDWQDINIIHVAGNALVDLDNAVVPQGQSVLILRKVLGRTRIVIPKELGLKLNISAISGKVYFQDEVIDLSMENYQWVSDRYEEKNRRIYLMVSVAFGDVEVIVL